MTISHDNVRGFSLALSSSFFIGSSFIVKKKGLKRAGDGGVRAGLFVCLFLSFYNLGFVDLVMELSNYMVL